MRQGVHRFPAMERVTYGQPFAAALSEEAERIQAQRVLLLVSGTLLRTTDLVEQARAALGPRCAGVWSGMGAHTPRGDVVKAAVVAREVEADLLVTLGGGSLTDAAKMIALCLGNDVTAPEQLDALRAVTGADGRTRRPDTRPPGMRSLTIGTTLSAGEYTAFAGCTDESAHVKESFSHPLMIPRSVILDPAATLLTPPWLWLSTGIRAVDHAVEDLCSITPGPMSDAASRQALTLLGRGLLACKEDPEDLAARLDCQLGAWLSMVGSQNGVPKGASHGIGHVLGGSAGVPHGYTSCIMLPHVLRFNRAMTAERQGWISEALGMAGREAGDAVADLVARLGLPGRLRDVGIATDQLDAIAEHSMHDRWVHTNPRRIEGPPAVRALLDAAY